VQGHQERRSVAADYLSGGEQQLAAVSSTGCAARSPSWSSNTASAWCSPWRTPRVHARARRRVPPGARGSYADQPRLSQADTLAV